MSAITTMGTHSTRYFSQWNKVRRNNRYKNRKVRNKTYYSVMKLIT